MRSEFERESGAQSMGFRRWEVLLNRLASPLREESLPPAMIGPAPAHSPLGDLYGQELRLWLNLFLPSVKLVQKVRVGSKVRRVYDGPRTPFERVRSCPQADRGRVARLEEIRTRRDPFNSPGPYHQTGRPRPFAPAASQAATLRVECVEKNSCH